MDGLTTKVATSADGGMVFKLRFEDRLIGAALLLVAVCAVAMLAKIYSDGNESAESKVRLARGIAPAGGLLFLVGLYVVQRWKHVLIGPYGVAVEFGWLFWRHRWEYALSGFAGVRLSPVLSGCWGQSAGWDRTWPGADGDWRLDPLRLAGRPTSRWSWWAR